MHEISLVRNVFKTLEDEFSAEQMQQLKTVKLKIGELSNVEPILMQNAFEAVQQDQPAYKLVTLSIEWVPATISCPNCGTTSRVQKFRFICDHCDTPTNHVLTGNELLIHQVEFTDVA